MSDRGIRRGAGAPFYAPPRRKTSAEIISEARAAIFGEMSGATSGSGSVGGALRTLRTRRPFTPREPQRMLYTDRTRKKDARPPSSFDLKYLTLSETSEEEASMAISQNVEELDEDILNGILGESQQTRKKAMLRNPSKSVQDRSGDTWSGFPKLPHLAGKSKPLHKRNTTQASIDESDLSLAISVTRPLAGADGDNVSKNGMEITNKSPENRRKLFTKSSSQDGGSKPLGNIAIKHLAVQMPATTVKYDNMSLLELSEELSNRNYDVNRIIAIIEAILNQIEKNVPANSLRELVLRSLYTHIDSQDEQVLVAIARAMLTIRVTGNHLAAACKLVFKIAKNDRNDHFFHNTNLLELCVEGWGRCEPVSEAECCVYGAAALRVLSLDAALATRALSAGALHLASLHLKILNNAKSENPRSLLDQSTHALFQLTGAMRNLASIDEREFVPSGALAELLAALLLHTDRDVLTNVARCLSVLSCSSSCCAWLCSAPTSSRACVRALAACAARAPLAVRLAYTLGNMAAHDERARINIYEEEGSIDVLLTILESYTTRQQTDVRDLDDPDLHLVETDLGGSDGSNEDVLVKTVRIIANLCLTERAGRGLATTHMERTVKALLACLNLAQNITETEKGDDESKDCQDSMIDKYEELATAALATLNNITFYIEPLDTPDPFYNTLDSVCKVTCSRLHYGRASSLEAVRALGNLSRNTRAAQLIVLHGALDLLTPYLHHEDSTVRAAAAGVLVNVCGSGADAGRAGVVAARAVRGAACERDVRSAALLARALWNAHAHTPLQHEHAATAASALAAFLDDESVFAACESSKIGNRRASDPALFKHQVKFESDSYEPRTYTKSFYRAISVDQDLHLDDGNDVLSGEDLGFEEGDLDEECECEPCRRLAAWEELVGVAIPLLEKLKPTKSDASVGTD